ncbi:vacuolar membrane protein hmt1 [Ceratocystis lukuohia]|uniref:Vacuolar membrane protein hmt1 n=1 Tax=Ceratocystis lukuohia TaxID=2019550 RepID=A0ABR4MK79_9PEZI
MSLAGRPFEASVVWNNVTGWLPIVKFSADDVLVTLRYVYPCSVYAYFMLSSITSVVFLHSLKASIHKKPDSFRTPWLIRFMHFCSFSYLAQLLTIFFHSFVAGKWLGKDDEVVSTAACMILYAIHSLCISDNQFPVWYPYYGSWSIGLICEPCMILVWAYTSQPFELGSFYDLFTLVLCSLRTLFYFFAIVVYMAKNQYKPSKVVLDEEQQLCLDNEAAIDAEQQPLLSNAASGSSDSGRSAAKNTPDRPLSSYGSTIQAGSTDSFVTGPRKDDDDQGNGNESHGNDDTDNMDGEGDENPDPDKKSEQELQKRLLEEGNWLSYLKRYKVLLPYIWPMRNYKLQFFAVLVAICSLTDNVLNLLLPRQLGLIMDSLTRGVDSIVWSQLTIYALLRVLGSDCGISFIREWLYFPIENYSKENLNRATFDHVLKLSADFHDSKSTSETMMAVRGGESFSSLIETVMLNGVGMIIDLFLAIIYLTSTFGPYEGLITTTTGTLYLFLSASLLIESRQAKRSYVMALYKEGKNLHDGIDGWQTVASFNQTRYERDRYSKSVLELIGHMKRYTFHWFGTRALQSLSLLVGLLAGCCLAIVRIKNGQATPGQFAMLLIKHISSMMIDAERVLDLLNTKITVTNQPGARPLRLTRGDVEFNGVSFGYSDKKNAVTGLSFFVHGGQSVAFVGVSGAGKSTILKLISRFYDPMEGSILVDNQNTKDVDIYSLRDHIGLVPQTPVLFNDTIMNNIRYARMSASDEEVHEACKAACIHDKIMGFPQRYETKVGERGVKLSGGELQRVAIARAILKRPDIVLLDEATSAVDTDTEQKIQASLKNLTENRTTFIVAHRLSTIMNADRIIVIDDGRILEMGDHESLLKVCGKYYSLWSKQVFLEPKKEEEEGKGKDIFVNDLSEETVAMEQAKATSLLHAQVPKLEDECIEDEASHTAGERQQGQVTASDIPTSVATNAGSRSTKSTIDTPMQRLSST